MRFYYIRYIHIHMYVMYVSRYTPDCNGRWSHGWILTSTETIADTDDSGHCMSFPVVILRQVS